MLFRRCVHGIFRSLSRPLQVQTSMQYSQFVKGDQEQFDMEKAGQVRLRQIQSSGSDSVGRVGMNMHRADRRQTTHGTIESVDSVKGTRKSRYSHTARFVFTPDRYRMRSRSPRSAPASMADILFTYSNPLSGRKPLI